MSTQKLIQTYVDPDNGSKAMEQIRKAAGEGTWRVVSIVSIGAATDAKRVSPGINDPHRLEGAPVLVLVEREENPVGADVQREAFETVH